MTPFWQEPFRVRFYEVEPNGRLSVPALCRYLQEAADRHSRSAGVALQQLRCQGRMWVIVRMRLYIFAQPMVNDDVTAETWPTSRIDGRRAYRDFRLRSTDGKVLAEAATLWLFLDAENHRPIRLPGEIDGERISDLVTPEPVEATKLAEPATPTMFARFQVRWRDLDANGHANNICYVEWLLETIPDGIRRVGSLRVADIHFKDEVLLGETVECETEQTSSGGADAGRQCFTHRLTASSGKTLAVARSEWDV
jgi:medium-chain acyl-[acyl-carrier-protein] hydrolase